MMTTRPTTKQLLCQPEWIMAICMTVVAVWLHVFFLAHAGGFWQDEVNVIHLAGRHSFNDMARDSFPVLMPLTVAGWSALGLGHSDMSLRLLGTLVGLGILAALWTAAWTMRRSPPLLGLALLGLNSIAITYLDSIRAYGLGSLLITLTAAGMWAFLKKPTWARGCRAAVLAALSVQALYQNAVLVGAICVGAWAVCWRQRAWRLAAKVLALGLVAAASLLPYWSVIASLPDAAAALRTGFDPATVCTNLNTAAGFPLPQYDRVWELFALLVIVHGFAILFTRGRAPEEFSAAVSEGDVFLFAGSTLSAAIVGFVGFLRYAALESQPWYFFPLMALAAACFDFGLPPVPRLLRAPFWGFVAGTALIAVPLAERDLNWRFTNVDLLARRLETEAAPGDFVIITPWLYGVTYGYYFKGPAPWDTLPPLEDHSIHRYDLVKEQMRKKGALQHLLNQIAATLQGGHRVWVVGNIDIPKPGPPLPDDLPPPPLKHSGWSDMPYRARWQAQAAQFLSNHSRRFEPVTRPETEGVNFDENAVLYRISGWNDSTSKTNPP